MFVIQWQPEPLVEVDRGGAYLRAITESNSERSIGLIEVLPHHTGLGTTEQYSRGEVDVFLRAV